MSRWLCLILHYFGRCLLSTCHLVQRAILPRIEPSLPIACPPPNARCVYLHLSVHVKLYVCEHYTRTQNTHTQTRMRARARAHTHARSLTHIHLHNTHAQAASDLFSTWNDELYALLQVLAGLGVCVRACALLQVFR